MPMGPEGGINPWKVQEFSNTAYGDLSGEAQKCLPPCPNNLTWVKFGEDWALVPKGEGGGLKQLNDDDIDSDIILQSPLLTHVVLEGETLSGICLRYRCTRREIEQLNRGTHIDEALGICDTLIVPNRLKCKADRYRIQFLTKSVAIQIFRRKVAVGDVEAKLYLEEADWNFENASKKAKEDLAWEQSALCERKSSPRPLNRDKQDSSTTNTGSRINIELPRYRSSRRRLKQD